MGTQELCPLCVGRSVLEASPVTDQRELLTLPPAGTAALNYAEKTKKENAFVHILALSRFNHSETPPLKQASERVAGI